MAILAESASNRNTINLRRRELLKVGAGAAALAALGLPAPAEAAARTSDTELFAFSAPHDGALVFAVTIPVQDDVRRSPTPVVRLHAGQKAWSVTSVTSAALTRGVAEESSTFVGRCMRTKESGDRTYHLVVVAVPRTAVPAGRLGIWAEVGNSDARVRVGNPIVTELLNQDPTLAGIFHRASPSQDVGLFGEAITRRIAMRSAAAVSPKARAERLAAMLLPDVLPFDPALPVGYTFANQNGRRPSDVIAEVVATVLAGAVAARPLAREFFKATVAFPYFEVLESPTSRNWPRPSYFRGSSAARA